MICQRGRGIGLAGHDRFLCRGGGSSRIDRRRVVHARLQLRLHGRGGRERGGVGVGGGVRGRIVGCVVVIRHVGIRRIATRDDALLQRLRERHGGRGIVAGGGAGRTRAAGGLDCGAGGVEQRAEQGQGRHDVLSFECGGRLRRTGRVGPHAQDLRGVFVGIALLAPGFALRFLRDAARLQDFIRADGAFLLLPVRACFVDTDFGRGQHAALLRDRGVERVDERLEIAPVAGRHPVLGGLREARVVFVAVAQQRVELLGGRGAVALRGAELLRGRVEVVLRAVEQQLKGKAVSHLDQPP
ncbi:hypothetical protein BCEP4_10026 [Burkholderia cepacia]|nr:hypothetical protein BCEP4_10026 [Burkholderia cepacia]